MPVETAKVNLHCWGSRTSDVPVLAPVIRSLPHGGGLGSVTLHDATGMTVASLVPSRLWISYDKVSGWPEHKDQLVREWCPIAGHRTVAEWGTRRSVRCHTTDKSHPWNDHAKIPGHHICGACGYPAWIEIHGVADGYCACCGYHG